MDETFPDLGSLTDRRTQRRHPPARRGGDRDLLQAADPARQDRHPARRAGEPPAQEARGRREHDHRRGRSAADGHPRPVSRHLGMRSLVVAAVGPIRRSISQCHLPIPGRSASDRLERRPLAMALHCTECGFVNVEGANYCQRCGALLRARRRAPASRSPPPTASTRPESWCRSRSTRSPRMAQRLSSAPAEDGWGRASPSTASG